MHVITRSLAALRGTACHSSSPPTGRISPKINRQRTKPRFLLATTFASLLLGTASLPFASAATTDIQLDGNQVAASNRDGLTFKGFGILTGNSSSELLMDYKAQNSAKYTELLRVLFGGEYPIMNHVKIEMGNDRNNSTGPDPATMRTASEAANVKRHPGFQLAGDALQLNADLRVSILRWNAPGWVTTNDHVYTWYKNTMLAADRDYGIVTYYVNPGLNEHAPDFTWIKQYANRVQTDSTGFSDAGQRAWYNGLQVVISDEVGIGTFGDEMFSDTALQSAVSVAAYHYNTDDDAAGNFKRIAEQLDKEVWNSEAQATFSNSAFRPFNNTKDPTVVGTGIGGAGSALEMGNTIIKGFVKSRRTHFIYQPAIGAFYEGGQYSFKELISARDPWSGWIHYDAGLQILRHFSWFAKTGWENSTNTAGIWRVVVQASNTGASGTNPVSGRNGTASYLTLAAPDRRNFSSVFNNDSEQTQTYRLRTVNMSYTGNPRLELWETRAAPAGSAFNSSYMKYRGEVVADGTGLYTITVAPFSIVTVTTLDKNTDAAYNTPLPVEGTRTVLDTDATGAVQNTTDAILYADNFEYASRTVPVIGDGGAVVGTQSFVDSRGGSKSVIPRYFSDRNGAFEAFLPTGSTSYVLRQQVDKTLVPLGGTWNNGNPVTGVGDNRWTNYKASVDVSFENSSTATDNYAAIGVRQQGGSISHTLGGTPFALKFRYNGDWELIVENTVVRSGNVATGVGGVQISGFNAAHTAWHKLALQVADLQVTAWIDGTQLTTVTGPRTKLSGRVDLASGYYHTRFDNLRVDTVPSYAPYYAELLDNLELWTLAATPTRKLIYGGSWAHANGKGMYQYQRSLSTSQGAGATLSYTFNGSGLDILGPNDGTAVLRVTVDGQVVNSGASTVASGDFAQTFALRGLAVGNHTIQLEVVSGTLVVDAVGVFAAATTALDSTTTYQKISNRGTGLYMDGMGRTTSGAAAGQYAGSTSNNQQWSIETSGSYVRIKNRATGLYLDGMGRTTSGSVCGQTPDSTSSNQQWTRETAGSYVKFKNRATGLYLDGAGNSTNGADLKQWPSSSSNNQQWSLINP